MNKEWNINFLENTPPEIQQTYCNKFSIGQNTFWNVQYVWCEAGPTYFF